MDWVLLVVEMADMALQLLHLQQQIQALVAVVVLHKQAHTHLAVLAHLAS